jgi:ferredoxin
VALRNESDGVAETDPCEDAMAHHTVRAGYHKLVDRLNRAPQGAPPSTVLFAILEMLFSEREAELVALLPIKPFTAAKAARIWKLRQHEARVILDRLADRAILLDVVDPNGETSYVLPPPMAGFFEFSMMRVRNDIDQKVLSELFYQYLNVEEEFIRVLFSEGETHLGRAFVHEPALPDQGVIEVLDYERASAVVDSATHRGIGVCYCRHKMQHMGHACSAPMRICMTFNSVADSLIRHGVASEMSREEGLDLLQQARDQRLVQFGDNVQQGVSFLCNCCGCCCEAMIAARHFGILNPVHTTNYLPERVEEDCNGCGKCVQACPVEAMSLVSANDPRYPKKKSAQLNEQLCLGCGVCVPVCSRKALHLIPRERRVITPVDSVHRVVLMAIERGKLQNLIFDNQALASHRAMAAILGVILRLRPFRQVAANGQIKSRYLEHLLQRHQA